MDLTDADLNGEDLSGFNLRGADLRGASLSSADLSRAALRGTALTRVDLSDARLSDAYLADADLTNAVMVGADLTRARLARAKLVDVRLNGAVLTDAVMHAADLTGADLSFGDLRRADLSGADLSFAVFHGTDLRDTDVTRASAERTLFCCMDLSRTRGLDTLRHGGPSTVGADTLYLSGGQIPEVFLRGCGLPDDLIAEMPSLAGSERAINYFSCFISYSSKDEEFAQRLHQRLRSDNLRVWFAPEDLKGGDKLHEQIERAIEVYDRLLLVISPASIESNWVRREVRRAREKERRTGARMLFPIRLTEFEAIDRLPDAGLAEELREYNIPDFSRWEDRDLFEAAMKRLIRDLRTHPGTTGEAHS